MQCPPQTLHVLILCICVEADPEQKGTITIPAQVCTALCFALSFHLSLFDSGLTYSLWYGVQPSVVHLFFESSFLKVQADAYNKEDYEIILPS